MDHVAERHGIEVEIGAQLMADLHQLRGPVKLPESPAAFYDFPRLCGWKIDNDQLRLLPAEQHHSTPWDLNSFLQAWLFLGLTLTVVQVGGKPALTFEQMVKQTGDTICLSTESLHEALKMWYDWESSGQNRSGRRLRMIRVSYVLDMARQVVRNTCALDYPTHYSDDPLSPLAIRHETALSIMCLGEALCDVRNRIIKDNEVDVVGWHPAEDMEGWGPPQYVFEKMKNDGWCPRAVRLLKGQFGTRATMLLSAYLVTQNSGYMEGQHDKCTHELCVVTPVDEDGRYQSRHVCADGKCQPLGPSLDKVLYALERDEVPLLRFRNWQADEIQFEVMSYRPRRDMGLNFIAISHVWSHGWGNAHANELNFCQLQFLQRQIQWVTGDPQTPFWMDTLLVPIGGTERNRRAKKTAIRQIYDVFDSSRHTIVIDNELRTLRAAQAGRERELAMKILSCGWTKRLWTLQEAFLSRSIYFSLMEDEDYQSSPIVSLDQIEEGLFGSMKELTSGVNRLVIDQLADVTMGSQRKKRNLRKLDRGVSTSPEEVRDAVISAWRAARWRTTARAEHETLALSTLLGLNIEGTEIDEAGLLPPTADTTDVSRTERLVRVFWGLVQKECPGAIPSGIIFLPGLKVRIRGYGWAPRTFLSTHEVDYSEPLNFSNKPTNLSSDGLLVVYSGFILHTDSLRMRRKILGMDHAADVFSFPVDRTLNEWYECTRADYLSFNPHKPRLANNAKLAIITSRLPRDSSREIALLVEIWMQRNSPESSEHGVDYLVRTIDRVYIWRRFQGPEEKSEVALKIKMGDTGPEENLDFPIGEMLGPRQRWWVDGQPEAGPPEDNRVVGSALKGNRIKAMDQNAWKGLMKSFFPPSASHPGS